jgi:hypothetical protein
MSRKPSVAGRRMASLRRTAYQIVDRRSEGQCEMHEYAVIEDGPRCYEPPTQHHHRRPRRSGGSTDPATETAANLLHLCERHHRTVELYRAVAYKAGWLIHAGHDPATTPVLLHAGWVTLNDEGTYTPTKETL